MLACSVLPLVVSASDCRAFRSDMEALERWWEDETESAEVVRASGSAAADMLGRM